MEEYVVRYEILPPHSIINYIGPKTEEQVAIHNARNNFFANLEESIKEKGIRNPIIVTAGWVPGPIRKNLNMLMEETYKTSICWQVGGSRLYVAQKLGLDIPCIVKDHNNVYSSPPLTTENEIWALFKDPPERITLDKKGLAIYWRTVRV